MCRLVGLTAKHRGMLLPAAIGPIIVAAVTLFRLAVAFPLGTTTGIRVFCSDRAAGNDRRLLDAETVKGPVRIAGIVHAFHRPREDDTGTTSCPTGDEELRFCDGPGRIAVADPAACVEYVVQMRESVGFRSPGGRSGSLVPGNDSLEPFALRRAEISARGGASG